MVCYKGALRAGGAALDREQRCHLHLTLCKANAAEKVQKARARTDGGGSRLSSTREQKKRQETECFSALLLEDEEAEGGCCSTAVHDAIVEESHLTSGLFRLCEEWDVKGALDHFLAATACSSSSHRRSSTEEQTKDEEEEDQKGRVQHKDDPAWGPVWLAQASLFTTYINC